MDTKELKKIIEMFETSSLSKIRLNNGDTTIELEKPVQQHAVHSVEKQQAPLPQETKTSVSKQDPSLTPIKAVLVGTFYEAPAPDQPPFVRVGQQVKRGDTLFIIEAMKVMNEITAPADGIIKSVHVQNGDMVMYDQVVMEMA